MLTNASVPAVGLRTEIDRLFKDTFEAMGTPYSISVNDEAVFRQNSSDQRAEVEEVFAGVGYFTRKGEEQAPESDRGQTDFRVTYEHETWAKDLEISKELYDDDQFGFIRDLVMDMADSARATREKNGFAVYRNAFSSSFVGGDGVALCSDSHPFIGIAGTYDNRLTLELTETNLDTAIQTFIKMKNPRGVVHGKMPATLLVAPKKFKLALEITKSAQRQGTANNDLNYYSMVYPGLRVATTPFLSDAISGADEDNWFLIGKTHGVKRFVREELNTVWKDWSDTKNHDYVMTARFRESYGWSSPVGVLGSIPA